MRRSRSPYPVIQVIFVFATDSRTGKRGARCTESHKTHFATLAKRQAPLRCELILIIDSESEPRESDVAQTNVPLRQRNLFV
jgi:hypothetical protein